MKRITIASMFLLCLLAPAGNVGGAELPDTMTVGGKELALNGAGLRKKFFIKVYAGALYLQSKTKDAKAVIDADEPMMIRMHFLYGVKPSQLTDAWNEGFTNALGEDGKAAMQSKIDAFNAMFTEKTKKGNTYDVVYTPGSGVEVRFNGNAVGKVEGLDFKKAVFSIWLGEKIPDKNLRGLKTAMLGG
ncbi:MAG: chalcone isomerase family protein [Acidobacteriota bacterium]|nr:chalcone isomerase family protein [Acidobacteriota bacterium]